MATELPSCRAALTQVRSWSPKGKEGRHDMIMWVKVGVKWLVKSNYGTYLFVKVVNSPAQARVIMRRWTTSWSYGRTFGIG